MSDCRWGGRFHFEPSHRPEEDRVEATMFFTDGSRTRLMANSLGREVDHFEVDGRKYVEEER